MGTQKKFGTFSGVLTPSLLTILGVIMYMRLGSVVGNSTGIVQVILIIVFAHLISITTGLSVSSISTDKKIEKGGIYYMLTRSLGLPIGGAIGLTIFVATAFSISLYLIGFSESLIPVLDDSIGIGQISINKLRLFGTLALCLVMLIAYISTSFALKIQYVILGLIVLSLGSIFLGSSEGLKKGTDVLNAPSFSVLFGIFFPAVTGFTAGVAMSGDLKNPRLSIPWGTMLSIFIGLGVYIILAVFIYYNIDNEILKSNNNVLIEFGAVSILVIGGVWGATLSSALGGILGGPRILQAMSIDNITPKIFAKGYGLNNEPRNALFLTFIIAELGILIGELNVIAELVAMFYMAAYLFINISCFLEQWSSPDFRPKFKIPIWISLVGAIATFLLMIQLNLAATLFAIMIMLIVWFWLSKKDLVLGTGDVWFSVWTSIVKTGLKNLQKKAVHRRNWQPNILLFSGGTKKRPYLIEFGKSISSRGGMVSNFDLIEDKSSNALFPKSNQVVKDEQINDDSIFHRRLYCQNVFKAIETIANTYGFSGIDPNTILMGWARNTKDPIYFGQMTQKLKDLDYNILYLDYDERRGFGNYSEIDVWWSTISKENELELQLIKFLKSSAKWNNSNVVIYYVNNSSLSTEDLISEIEGVLEKKRIRAQIKIINNVIEKRNLNELIRTRSYSADLVLMSLPNLVHGKEKDFINASNNLFEDIGSALFIEASSNFNLTSFNQVKKSKEVETSTDFSISKSVKASLITTFDNQYDFNNKNWQNELILINEEFSSNLKNSISYFISFYSKVSSPKDLKDELVTNLYNTQELNSVVDDFEINIANNIEDYFLSLNRFINTVPKRLNYKYSKQFYEQSIFNKLSKSPTQIRRTISLNKKDFIEQKLNVFKLFDYHFKNEFVLNFNKSLKKIGAIQLQLFHQYKDYISNNSSNEFPKSIEKLAEDVLDRLNEDLNQLIAKILNVVVIDIAQNKVKRLISERDEQFDPKIYRKNRQPIEDFSSSVSKNALIFHNHKVMCCTALIVKELAIEEISEQQIMINNQVFSRFSAFVDLISKKISDKKIKDNTKILTEIEGYLTKTFRDLDQFSTSKNIQSEIDNFPSEINVFTAEYLNDFLNKQTIYYDKTYYLQSTLKSIYFQSVDSKLKHILQYNKEWLKNDLEEIISAIKLLNFTKDNQSDSNLIKDAENKLLSKIDGFKINLNKYKERVLVDFSELKSELNKILDFEYLLSNNSKKVVESNNDDRSGFYKKFEKLQIQLSEGFLSFVNFVTPEENTVQLFSKLDKLKALRTFISNCSPEPSLFVDDSRLYLQLFNNNTQPNPFFSSFVSEQLIEIKKLISNFNPEFQNVILISGDPQSGKSYLMNQLSYDFEKESCYIIDPPIDLSNQPVEETIKTLIHQPRSSIDQQLSLEDLKEGSIVFVYDFEMWWRKNEGGYFAINSWLELFDRYAKIIFVIEINDLLKNHLIMTTSLNSKILKYVNTNTFSNYQLEEITNQKSKMSGQVVDVGLNKINFRKLANISYGNIGWFNAIWLSFLTNNNSLELVPKYDLKFPNSCSDSELLVLLQFYWHKRINIDHISSYFNHIELNELNEILSFLKAEKLIVINGSSMEINYYVVPYLKRYFKINNFIS
tara:strand:- start:12650 stop:17536 length:4887 start_codon:yes stop_codon:yes gene_type:complete